MKKIYVEIWVDEEEFAEGKEKEDITIPFYRKDHTTGECAVIVYAKVNEFSITEEIQGVQELRVGKALERVSLLPTVTSLIELGVSPSDVIKLDEHQLVYKGDKIVEVDDE